MNKFLKESACVQMLISGSLLTRAYQLILNSILLLNSHKSTRQPKDKKQDTFKRAGQIEPVFSEVEPQVKITEPSTVKISFKTTERFLNQ